MDDLPTGGVVPAEPAGFNATCTSCPASVPGRIGRALRFDGASNRIALPVSDLVGRAPFSVSVWVQPEATSQLYSVISKPVDNTTVLNVLSITVSGQDGTAAYETSEGSTIVSFPQTGGPDLRGAWHHVAVTWDGAMGHLYVDGGEVAAQAINFNDSVLPINIGSDFDGGAPAIFYRGDIDEVRFYRHALSTSELSALANP